MSALTRCVAVLCALVSAAHGLNNGVGFLPEMGINTWYMLHSNLINYTWAPGYCLSCDVAKVLEFLNANGFPQLGYNRANFDDCVVVGRDAENNLIPDPAAFPSGVLNASQTYAALGYKTGFYSVRNNFTCASGPPPRIERPGSNGFEQQDADFYSKNGIVYLKLDSCGDPEVPFPVMGAALNKTGTQIFYALCEPGGGPQVAPTGRQVGNGWRTGIDDGACAILRWLERALNRAVVMNKRATLA